MIKTKSLYKRFDQPWVLENLNLNITKGEFYCLLGPNGAGKTTTLKLLTGLLRPTQGRVYIDGFDISNESQRAKKLLGFIPDSPFLYENLTGEEFLEFIGNIFDIRKTVLKQRIDYYLELFGLTSYKKSLLRDYSHGMKQKIVYISNFIHNPAVLLVDEPLVGLDPQAIHLIKHLLREKIKEGMTVLMCTHILQIAEELADRVGILEKGCLIAEGTIEELRKQANRDSLEAIFLKLTAAGNPDISQQNETINGG